MKKHTQIEKANFTKQKLIGKFKNFNNMLHVECTAKLNNHMQ